MGRYIFKKKDLEPLRKWLGSPLARVAIRYTLPVKRIKREQPPIRETIPLPVPVQSHDQPDGVPLHELLRAIQAELPTVTSIAVRGDKAILKHSAPPPEPQREKVRKLLSDPKKLQALRQPSTQPSPQPSTRPALLAALRPADLEKLLLDEETPDAEWLKAFRRYAVANLIKPKKASK
jgi:hypothetical protein